MKKSPFHIFHTHHLISSFLFFLSILIAIPAPLVHSISSQTLDFYDQNDIFYHDDSDCLSNSTSPSSPLSTDGKDITIIGDSITVGSANALKDTFNGLEDSHINARVGRPWSEGISELKKTTLTNILIFALGTNSSNLTQSNIEELLKLAGNSNVVLVTNHVNPLIRPDLNYTSNNKLFRQTAHDMDNVILADWQGAIDGKESTYLTKDGVHPNSEGQKLFAKTIADALSSSASSRQTNSSNPANPITLSTSLPQSTITALESAKVTEKAKANQALYEQTSNKTGVPWQALAAIHFMEANMDPNRSLLNGQPRKSSAYTNVDGVTIHPGALDDAITAAEIFKKNAKGVYGVEISASSSVEDFTKAFVAYNRGYMYKQAGISPDRSPYAMNGYDEQHLLGMRFTNGDSYANGKKVNNLAGKVSNRPGALAVMAYLGGSLSGSISSSNNDTCDVNAGGYTSASAVTEGGLTFEQAKIFMMRYGENLKNDSAKTVGNALWNMCNGGGSNCVTFSAFFLKKFTDTKVPSPTGNGWQVVSNLGSKSGLQTDITPGVFSIFSSKPNHTGVVLGIHGNEYIIGHASCTNRGKGKGDGVSWGLGSGFVKVEKGPPSQTHWWGATNGTLTFAYPQNVDTKAIENYVNYGP